MTKEEVKKKLDELSKKFDKEKQALLKQCAEENCNIKIGDIVTDHFQTIKVEKMTYYYDYVRQMPIMVFHGANYKKDGTIAKRQKPTQVAVYQTNVKFVNGKEYKFN
jgi:hypothetical protein